MSSNTNAEITAIRINWILIVVSFVNINRADSITILIGFKAIIYLFRSEMIDIGYITGER